MQFFNIRYCACVGFLREMKNSPVSIKAYRFRNFFELTVDLKNLSRTIIDKIKL